MNDRYLSVAEISTYLGIKRDTVYKWISKNELPAHRVVKTMGVQYSKNDKLTGSLGSLLLMIP